MTAPGPGSGDQARGLLYGLTDITGDDGEIVLEDYAISRLSEPDGDPLAWRGSIHSALAFAEEHYARTGEPVRVIRYREREVARVGVVA